MGTSLLAKHNNSPITAAKQHSRMEIHCKQTIIYEQTFQDREYCPKVRKHTQRSHFQYYKYHSPRAEKWRPLRPIISEITTAIWLRTFNFKLIVTHLQQLNIHRTNRRNIAENKHISTILHTQAVVIVSGMQLLRLCSAIRRHHPPQRAVLSQICCFGERKVVLFQILLDGAEPRDAGTT